MKILVLAGDGVGPEVTAEAVKIIRRLNADFSLGAELTDGLVGGDAYEKTGVPLPDETLEKARTSDAILLGAVGGPAWDNLPRKLRPETGLLTLRQTFDLFANLRPALLFPGLTAASTLRPEVVEGLDLMIVRELVGGIYFGKPRGIIEKNGERYGFNTAAYDESEIERIAHLAFQTAERRRRKLCSVDKANVLEVSELWREVFNRVAADYPKVALSHMYVDNAMMQLVRAPKQFDVIASGNMFGDILSDCAAMLTGSIGMLASASLNAGHFGMYEPVHGSAPDIAGKNRANPLAMILSVAMMLRHSLNQKTLADKIHQAVVRVLKAGHRTADIAAAGDKIIGTSKMGDLVADALS